MTEIYSFGERQSDGQQWYADKEGNRTSTNEAWIGHLWSIWVLMKGVEKSMSEDGFYVYSSPNPIMEI